MNRLISLKSVAAASLALGAIVATSAAHARSDVFLSIGLPGVYVQSAPVYVEPQPVYVQPRPVYVQPRPVYVQPQPVYTQAPVYYGQGWERRGYGHGYGHYRHAGRYGPNGDLDRDGISNQHDRDRDGDGIRNRHDRAPNNSHYR